MDESSNYTPFAELPESLVDDMLSKSEPMAAAISKSLELMNQNKKKMRNDLESNDILRKDTDLGSLNSVPSACGVDGSFIIENLLALDLVAGAAVRVEGFNPKQDTREMDKTQHDVFIASEKHEPDTGSILRGLVMEMEVILAAESKQEVVLLDGSFTSRIIHMNQAVNADRKLRKKYTGGTDTGNKVIEYYKRFINDYKTILKSINRAHTIWASLPKLTTRNELGKAMGWKDMDWYSGYDDKAILTAIMNPGEFTRPIRMEEDNEGGKSDWHLSIPDEFKDDKYTKNLNDEMASAVSDLYVFYYRPHSHCPAFRVEVGSSAVQYSRLPTLIQALKYQSTNSVVMEPYPLYMADRIAKHLSTAVPAFRQIITQHMALSRKSEDIFFSMHNYRTESGI
jgi:hypothetical protein